MSLSRDVCRAGPPLVLSLFYMLSETFPSDFPNVMKLYKNPCQNLLPYLLSFAANRTMSKKNKQRHSFSYLISTLRFTMTTIENHYACPHTGRSCIYFEFTSPSVETTCLLFSLLFSRRRAGDPRQSWGCFHTL
jgi:hypothetical protein